MTFVMFLDFFLVTFEIVLFQGLPKGWDKLLVSSGISQNEVKECKLSAILMIRFLRMIRFDLQKYKNKKIKT